jgi:nitroreductase
METWDAIIARRNVRSFADRRIPEAELERVLQAGWAAPSASNRQHREARAILGVPNDHYCAYFLALGYPADRPLAPLHYLSRRPFDQVVHRGRW